MRGSLKQKRPGVWRIIITTGYEADGTGRMKQRRSWSTFHGTRKQAEDRLNELVGHVRTGQFVEPTRTTVIAWFREWLEAAVKPRLRASTYGKYRGLIENHIAKAPLALVPLQKLRPSHIERYYATADISPSAAAEHHAVIHQALRKAVREKLINVNPSADLDHAPRRKRGRDEDARVNCWTASDARTFLETARQGSPQVAALFALALDTGMRRGELCGLRWQDVDFDAGKIRIVQQLWKPGLIPQFGPTKTGKPRSVTLAAETLELLRAHRKAQAELKMANRTTYRDHGLVFAKTYGDITNRADMLGLPLQANHFSERLFQPLVKKAGVKRITPHGMRHTCATLLLLAGEPVHVVADRLGHSDVSITWNTYSHVLPDAQKGAAQRIGGVLYGRN